MNVFGSRRRLFPVLLTILALAGGASSALLGVCGPFTDVTDAGFCPFVLEIFTLGITTGTTPTTYDPGATVTRLQMAAFLSRTVDRTLQRLHPRSTLRQFWTPQTAQAAALTTFSIPGTATIWLPFIVESDGADVWAAGNNFLIAGGFVARVRASDGALLGTWTGMNPPPQSVLVALGKVFMPGFGAPGKLYGLDPTQPPGAVTTLASNVGDNPQGIAFDGTFVWTANGNGTASKITPSASPPWPVTTVPGFTSLQGILYDGANLWVTDKTAGTLLKLNASGAILQTVTVGTLPFFPSFDGTNIWVPNQTSNSVSVVRASSGVVLATLTGNGMNTPTQAAFDGQRVLVTNYDGGTVSLWKAADLTEIGVFSMGTPAIPYGACSDGVSFWIATLAGLRKF